MVTVRGGGGRLVVNVEHLDDEAKEMRVFGARFGGRRRTERAGEVFTITAAEPTGARVGLADGAGNPLILEHPTGAGCVSVICATHALSGEAVGADSRYLPFAVEYLKDLATAVFPLAVRTDRGRTPQYMLNRTRNGWLAIAGSHYPEGWKGRLLLALGGGETAIDVTERWTGAPAAWRIDGRKLVIDVELPAYRFGVFDVRVERAQ